MPRTSFSHGCIGASRDITCSSHGQPPLVTCTIPPVPTDVNVVVVNRGNVVQRMAVARPRRPNIKDIARAASVSPMTVSRALRSGENVAADTLARVQIAAAQLGYVHTRPPAHLGKKSAGLIGVVIPTIADSLFADFLQGIDSAARPANYDILLGVSRWAEEREEEVVRGLLSRQPDGLIFAGCASPSTAALLSAQLSWLRVAETWESDPNPLDILVGFNNFLAGEIAAEYLLARDFRHLFYCGPTTGRDGLRCDGFFQAAKDVPGAYVELLPEGDAQGTDGPPRNVSDLIDHVLRCGNRPAIFCATDEIAYGLLFEAARRGVRVPADMAICGCGDRPLSAMIEPRLTTVRIPTEEMGFRAARELIDAMNGTEPVAPTVLNPELTVRASC
jgi:LacI family gluconate utilization system Gnt-I transcriptional repressor